MPLIIGAIVAVGALSATAIALTLAGDRFQPPPSRTSFQSIDIEMPKTTFQVGERLNFTINTHGICASPNVTILRYDETNAQALKVYEYTGGPISCPPQNAPGEPHLRWEAERLEQRFYDDYFGGDGNSVITTSAAITLKKEGNYIISASLLDRSDSVSKEFSVRGEGIAPIRMNLTSLEAYATNHELIGKVVPGMEFKKGELVFFNATFANPSVDTRYGAVLTVDIKDNNENPLPDDVSTVTGNAMSVETISVENSWTPQRAGGYDIVIFSLRESDLKSTAPVSPVAIIPIRVVG